MATVAAPRSVATQLNSDGPSHPFTCNTCQVAFRGSDLQRTHMQSDWHRYNLKRRVASLPPLTSEIFAEKVLATQASAAATAAKASYEKICGPCQRTYYSQNAYENHLGSQKHRARVAQLQNDSAAMSATTDDASSLMSSTFSLGEPIEKKSLSIADSAAEREFAEVVNGVRNTKLDAIDRAKFDQPLGLEHSRHENSKDHSISQSPQRSESTITATSASGTREELNEHTTRCLFCNVKFDSLDENVKHMGSAHSMFIPERSYLVDLEGLLKYLHDRIFILHECLYCRSIRSSSQGIQKHMRDKGHSMIGFESEEEMIEVGQFYDFRSSYSDEESEEEEEVQGAIEPRQRSNVKLGAKGEAKIINEEDAAEYDNSDEEGWEDESDEEYETGDESIPKVRSLKDISKPVAFHDEYELHLPSGRTAGHRSLARYYRQNLHSYPTPAERESRRMIRDGSEEEPENDGSRQQRGRQLVSRADGGLGLLSAPEAAKRQAKAVELKEQRRQARAETRYKWGNERMSNNQKHFRDPLLQ